MPVKEADRAEFEAFGDLGFDGQGREILVGLSYEETEWYFDVFAECRRGHQAAIVQPGTPVGAFDVSDVRHRLATATFHRPQDAPEPGQGVTGLVCAPL